MAPMLSPILFGFPLCLYAKCVTTMFAFGDGICCCTPRRGLLLGLLGFFLVLSLKRRLQVWPAFFPAHSRIVRLLILERHQR